jgi:hypothetical protein
MEGSPSPLEGTSREIGRRDDLVNLRDGLCHGRRTCPPTASRGEPDSKPVASAHRTLARVTIPVMTTRGAGRASVRSVGGVIAALLLVLVPMSALAAGWTIVASPNAVGSLDTDQLYATTCASSTECWAVGQYLAGTAIEQTLIQATGGGSWTTVGSPNVNDGGTQSNSLYGVTCASPTECWAVGEHGTSPDQQTLVEEWTGGSWVVVDSPSTSATQNNLLFGVACATPTMCWADGSYQSSSGVYQTLVELWDGTSWAIVASPDTASTQYNELIGVTCASST